ncbi:MAG: VanZ family protein [Bacilli bacterium]|nr:VanZ family protein [Bacilli bacterium]
MEAAIKSVIIDAWPSLAVLLSIVIIMRITRLMKGEGEKWPIHMEIFNLFFIAYMLLLFRLVTSQDLTAIHSTNFMPFREILRYELGSDAFYKQVIGNIVLFIPFGYFVTSYCNIKKIWTIFIVSGLSSLVIEVVQHFIGRSFDVDDIILNIVGGIIGYLLYTALNAIRNHLPKPLRKDWFLNIISIAILVLVALYLIKIF